MLASVAKEKKHKWRRGVLKIHKIAHLRAILEDYIRFRFRRIHAFSGSKKTKLRE